MVILLHLAPCHHMYQVSGGTDLGPAVYPYCHLIFTTPSGPLHFFVTEYKFASYDNVKQIHYKCKTIINVSSLEKAESLGAHLENKHFPSEKGHCVKIAITDVGFSIARRGPVTRGWSRRMGLTVIFPFRRRVSPPWWKGWKRPSWFQHSSWDTWESSKKFKLELS